MHIHESSIIITKDGLYCQVYGNQHPEDRILIKPKYIPTEKISSNALPFRFISGKKMNRLDLWANKDGLKEYLDNFCKAYPEYVFESSLHDKSPLFFAVPMEKIEKIYSPKTGLAELMSMPENHLDEHLQKVVSFVSFLIKSNISLENLGITYSTLMGHYFPNKSDINIVVYGKENFWTLMEFLEKNNHEELRWKTPEEWGDFYSKRNRSTIHKKEVYLKNMHRKKSEGFFNGNLFVIFGVENDDEVWCRWGQESYKKIGTAKFKAVVEENKDSIVRPGRYKVIESQFIDGDEECKNVKINNVVFYSRDYCMLASPKEQIEARGVIEEVTKKSGEKSHRLVMGYFDSYLNEVHNSEYIRVLDDKND